MEKAEWDDSLQGDLLNQWKLILAELRTLSSISIDRCYFASDATNVTLQDFVTHLLRFMLQWCIYE